MKYCILINHYTHSSLLNQRRKTNRKKKTSQSNHQPKTNDVSVLMKKATRVLKDKSKLKESSQMHY